MPLRRGIRALVRGPARSVALTTVCLLVALGAACEATSAPAPEAVPASSAGSSTGVVGPGQYPTLPPGPYRIGTAHVDFSGDRPGAIDVDLVAATSVTSPGGTLLNFARGGEEFQFAMGAVGFAVGATTTELTVAGAWNSDCTLAITTNDAVAFAGRVICAERAAQSVTGREVYRVGFEATFSAQR